MFQHSKKLYTINDLTSLSSRSRAKLYEDLNSGDLESLKIGSRRLFTPEMVDSYVDNLVKRAEAE
jgi:hypothetical protein